MTPRVPKPAPAIVAALILATLASSCQPEESAPPPRPRRVITHRVTKPSATIVRSFSGVTRAADSAEMGFEVSGRIREMIAVAGRRYESGTVLARLDATNYEAELARAKAEADRANEELKRVQQLYETENASQAQFDSAVAASSSAVANLTTAEKRVSDCTLTMPYPGFIGEVLQEEQELTNAGAPVFRIQGEDGMEFRVGIPADLISHVTVGLQASVTIGGKTEDLLGAKVSKVARQASRNTTYEVTLRLSSSEPDLREGMDGEATLELPNPNGATISVPAACVGALPEGGRFAWLVRESESADLGTVTRVLVDTGSLRPNGEIEIPSGLTQGQLVVAKGVHRVEEGMTVRLR